MTYFSARIPLEIYLGAVAILFLGGGIAAGAFIMRRRERKLQAEGLHSTETELAPPDFDPGLSDREREVLLLIAQGLSNQEIADKLFVSLNTVKTHTSNLYQKLDVRRRTQAVSKARALRLIPNSPHPKE